MQCLLNKVSYLLALEFCAQTNGLYGLTVFIVCLIITLPYSTYGINECLETRLDTEVKARVIGK